MRQQGMGDSPGWGRFQTEMLRVWTSDYDTQETSRKKYQGNQAKDLKSRGLYAIILTRDI